MKEATELDKYWVNDGYLLRWSLIIIIFSIGVMVFVPELFTMMFINVILGIILLIFFVKNMPEEEMK